MKLYFQDRTLCLLGNQDLTLLVKELLCLLTERCYVFSVIGITEIKITNSARIDFNPHMPNYQFEQVPTPLSCGGDGMYVNTSLNYTIPGKTANEAFQTLWIELEFLKGKNVICGVIYRQHNSPEQFQTFLI